MEERVHLFQNWCFSSNTLDEFRDWDIRGEKYEILKNQDIYVHTDDNKNSFLIISLNKEKLLEYAEKRKREQIKECESKIKWLTNLNFK